MPDSTSLSLREAESDVCRQIREIMQVYRKQAASSYGVDTPGGLEHMGDVWALLRRWDEKLERASPPSSPGAPQTRFDDFDDDAHPFRKWWQEHGQFMLSGGGRRESIWAARGWIAREQMVCGVKVTGDSMHERASSPGAARPSKCPTCARGWNAFISDGTPACYDSWHSSPGADTEQKS